MPLSKSRSSTSRRNYTTTAPQPTRPANPPMATTASSGPSMMDSMKQGFGLGVGLEAARAAVGGLTGMLSSNKEEQPIVTNQPLQQQNNSCEGIVKALEKCQAETPDQCQPLLDLLKKCASS
jgi:hypothetical protein